MSTQKFATCDRCGATEAVTVFAFGYTPPMWSNVMWVGKRGDGYDSRSYDLCKECTTRAIKSD